MTENFRLTRPLTVAVEALERHTHITSNAVALLGFCCDLLRINHDHLRGISFVLVPDGVVQDPIRLHGLHSKSRYIHSQAV